MTARSVSGSRATSVATCLALVGQRDLDLVHAFDHVVIGEDVAPRIDDHAGAHAVDAARGLAAGGRGCRRGTTVFSPRMLTTDGRARWIALTIGDCRNSDAAASVEPSISQRANAMAASRTMSAARPRPMRKVIEHE